MSRPEEQAPPDLFYNEAEANKYLHSSRMIEIQSAMSERALEMLCLPEGVPCMLLDVGCGTGLSGETLEEAGHRWVGVDISADMLRVAQRREVEGDLVHRDMGSGLPFRQGTFDGAISVSAIQWLCYSDSNADVPRKRLVAFFQSLYKCLRRGARAALQFYPQARGRAADARAPHAPHASRRPSRRAAPPPTHTPRTHTRPPRPSQDAAQLQLITASAMRAGFGGGLVVDFPNSTKAKKYFLVLLAGPPDPGFTMPTPEGAETGAEPGGAGPSAQAVRHEGRQHARRRGQDRGSRRVSMKSREWVMAKKESQRRQGKEVKSDSKYTARRRSKPKF